MTDRTVKISDEGFAVLGRKLSDWSLNPETRPRTVGAFRAQVENKHVLLGAGFTDDEEIDWLMQKPLSQRLSLLLPAAEDMQLQPPPERYPVPDFYRRYAFRTEPAVAQDDRETFRLCRIADYAASRCM